MPPVHLFPLRLYQSDQRLHCNSLLIVELATWTRFSETRINILSWWPIITSKSPVLWVNNRITFFFTINNTTERNNNIYWSSFKEHQSLILESDFLFSSPSSSSSFSSSFSLSDSGADHRRFCPWVASPDDLDPWPSTLWAWVKGREDEEVNVKLDPLFELASVL